MDGRRMTAPRQPVSDLQPPLSGRAAQRFASAAGGRQPHGKAELIPGRLHVLLGPNAWLCKEWILIQVASLAAITTLQTCTAPLPQTSLGQTALGWALWHIQGNDRYEHTSSILFPRQSTLQTPEYATWQPVSMLQCHGHAQPPGHRRPNSP